MFKTRRKSGDDADRRNKYANKLTEEAAGKNKAHHLEHGGSISLQRSDGLHHDLNSVFTNPNIAGVIQETTAQLDTNSVEEEDHDKISISRSDGVTHDLIRVFKATNDIPVDGCQQPSPPTVSHFSPVINRAHSKGRSISLSIKEFAKMATGTNKPVSSSRLPTADSAYQSISLNSAPVWAPKHVRIVHMSDTHNFLDKSKRSKFLPRGDILVHTGAFTNRGTEEEFAQFNAWLGSVTDLYHYRIVILGCKDVKLFGNDWEVMKRMLPNATHVLCHSEACVLGIRFYGSPWHWGHKHNYTVRPGAPSSTSGRFEDIPAGIHVLLTHGPAYLRLDATTAAEVKEHWGSRELAEQIRRVRPGLHLHGHVKDSRGVLPAFANSPLTINSAMVDKDITVLCCAPYVIKATRIMTDFVSNKNFVNWSFALDSLDG